MASELIRNLVDELPWRLQESVQGYVDAVESALPAILADIGVRLSPEKTSELLLIIAIRKIWASINGQHWIIEDSLAIAQRNSLEGFQVGRDRIVSDSATVAESRELHRSFERLLVELEITDVVTQGTLTDVVRRIAETE